MNDMDYIARARARRGGGGGGGEAVLVNKTVSANGTYLPAADSADGYKKVVVNVPTPTPTLITKTVTANGTYSAEDDNADGYSSVTVNVQGGEPQEVPEGYTQLKYIKSSGAQYIDTGVAPTLDTKMWAQGFYLTGNGGYYPMMGAANPSCQMGAYNVVGGGAAYSSFGNQTDKIIQDSPLLAGEQPPTIEIDKNGATITAAGVVTKSVAFSATTMSGSAATHIALFGRGNSGSFERLAKAAIFRAKIYDNGVLIREFVPCIQKSNDEVGMYDIVNDVFYGNDGTGVFEGVEL